MRIGVVCVIKEAWGGSEELWAAMAHEAIAAGHEVIVSAYNCGEVHPKMQALIDKGLKLIYRRGYVKPGLPLFKRVLSKATVILQNKLQNPFDSFFKARPDWVLYVGTDNSLIIDTHLIEGLKEKTIDFFINVQLASDFRRVMSMADTNFLAHAFLLAKHVYFVSEHNKASIERHLAISLPNSTVVRNPANLPSLDPIPFPKNDVPQFAMVGNLILAHKGQDIVFDLLRQPKWMERKWHLNIYGKGMDEEFLKKLSTLYGLKDRITFHGRTSNIREVWANNHSLLMPSLMEGMALAVVEAMLCGRLVVATDAGGHKEWIKDGINGFIAEAPSTDSFGSALQRAWDKQQDWKYLGQKAKENALALFDVKAGKSLLNLILNS